jgi:NTE family protein
LMNDQLLVDGGVTSPVPVETVKKMGADLVIAVNLYNHYVDGHISEKDNFIKTGLYTINLMIHKLSYIETQSADLIVYPNTKNISLKTLLNQKEKINAIYEGEKAMEAMTPELKRLIAEKQHEGIWRRLKNIFDRFLQK